MDPGFCAGTSVWSVTFVYFTRGASRYNTFIWIPNLVAFITMLAVSGRHLMESPLSNPTHVGVPNIMTFGATLAASVVNWSPLMPDQGVYHDHSASACVALLIATMHS